MLLCGAESWYRHRISYYYLTKLLEVNCSYKQLKNIAEIKDSNGNACLFNGLTILERARFLYGRMMSMSMAVNAVYNRMQTQQASIQRPKSKGGDFTQAVKRAVDSYEFCGVSEFHSAKDCAADEIYFGYAVAGEPGNDTELPCNFHKPVDYNEEDPVIIARMYPWDGTEAIVREIHVNDVNLSSADYYDTFAYGIYLEEKGEIPNMNDLLIAYDLAHDNSSSENDGMFDKADVICAIEEFMKAGLEQGYYKQYLDFLQLYNVVNKHNDDWLKDGNSNRQADEYLEA